MKQAAGHAALELSKRVIGVFEMAAVVGVLSSPGLVMLSQVYGFVGPAAKFAVQHVETLKAAENILANRCGQVLEAAITGFGMGAETALILIGVGQGLLGNPLTGGAVVAAASNPIVLTCAAIGAIHYGWKAMSKQEQDTLLISVSAAFKVGVEFIRSITRFAFELIQTLMSRENFEELKKIVASVAAAFGHHLSDITGALSDRLTEGAKYVSGVAGGAASTLWSRVPSIRLRSKSAKG